MIFYHFRHDLKRRRVHLFLLLVGGGDLLVFLEPGQGGGDGNVHGAEVGGEGHPGGVGHLGNGGGLFEKESDNKLREFELCRVTQMYFVPYHTRGHSLPKDISEGDDLGLGGEGDGLEHARGEGGGVFHHINGFMEVVFDLMRGGVATIVEESWKGANKINGPFELGPHLAEHVDDVGHQQVEALLGQ